METDKATDGLPEHSILTNLEDFGGGAASPGGTDSGEPGGPTGNGITAEATDAAGVDESTRVDPGTTVDTGAGGESGGRVDPVAGVDESAGRQAGVAMSGGEPAPGSVDVGAGNGDDATDGWEIVYDPATGEIIGTAKLNPETGVTEFIPVDTMTVIESPSKGSSGAVVLGLPGVNTISHGDRPGQTSAAAPAPGRGPSQNAVTGVVDPGVFDFHPSAVDNWQETGCVAIAFARVSPILGPQTFKVGVKVGVPTKLADGHEISVFQAQIWSADAAEKAARIVAGMLNEGIAIGAAQKRFVGFMFGALNTLQMGFRVNGCVPA